MIGWLKGRIVDVADQRITVALVHSPSPASVPSPTDLIGSGVGYQVLVAHRVESPPLLEGETVELYIHTHVREDALELFGFLERSERELFLTLMSVNGIGPKLGISILSNASPARVVQAISDGNTKALTELPGIGKKMAERMVLELGDLVRKKISAGIFSTASATTTERSSGAPAQPIGQGGGSGWSGMMSQMPASARDAVSALLSLGYRESDALQMLESVMTPLSAEQRGALSTQDWIKRCLVRPQSRAGGEHHV